MSYYNNNNNPQGQFTYGGSYGQPLPWYAKNKSPSVYEKLIYWPPPCEIKLRISVYDNKPVLHFTRGKHYFFMREQDFFDFLNHSSVIEGSLSDCRHAIENSTGIIPDGEKPRTVTNQIILPASTVGGFVNKPPPAKRVKRKIAKKPAELTSSSDESVSS